MSRITGTWKLVSMEGVDRLSPSVDQFMELTKDEISEGVYKAKFTNFQEEFCDWVTYESGDSLYSTVGSWKFTTKEDYFVEGCGIGEDSRNKQGLDLNMDNGLYAIERWKILELRNDKLKLINNVCLDNSCFYIHNRILIFEKVD
ncbi:hypothetical protein [Parvicella tangerina]|nr:hypothetical protein [Parvicella tangerina]